MATRTKAKKDKADDDVKVEHVMRSLRVQLTPDEVADRADRAAAKLLERDDKEADQKAAAKAAKAVIDQLEAELRVLSGEVRTRSTYRDVEVERRYQYKAGRVIETRTDTGEVIEDREMHEYEMQRELFDGNGQPASAPLPDED